MAKLHFKRPKFTPLPQPNVDSAEDQQGVISSLAELISFNAIYNSHHSFCIQTHTSSYDEKSSGGHAYHGCTITFAQLQLGVENCADWLKKANMQCSDALDGSVSTVPPVALYLESDVGLFIHLAALQSLDIPVLLLSARLSPTSVQHLLKETGSRSVLVSERTRKLLAGQILDHSVRMTNVEPYTKFLPIDKVFKSNTEALPVQKSWPPERNMRNDTELNLILHSSGTTGLPKPIYLTNRYLLQYASCHEFSPQEHIDWSNLSTLPLYHGFGFLAPCLSLSIGMVCVFPPSTLIPAGRSTLDLLESFHCRSMMTVPSIVGEMMLHGDAVKHLAILEFLAVGGGALSSEQGAQLKSKNINLLNHYGVTEIGAIAPIFRPGPEYNWRFLRLRSDIGLQLHPIEKSCHFKLIGFPLGWNTHFEVQDELQKNPETVGTHAEIRIIGRVDDLIVLKTGEKVMPQHLEATLHESPAIKTAVCLGHGRFEIVVLVEPAQNLDKGIDPGCDTRFVDLVWDTISKKNADLDRHARISSKRAIIIKPPQKTIPRTDKGSVSRRQVHEVFADELDSTYAAIDDDAHLNDLCTMEQFETDIELGIRVMLSNIFSDSAMDATQDFFESGMDSLQAVRLSRLLNSAMRSMKASNESIDRANGHDTISAEFIYRNPSIHALVGALQMLVGDPDDQQKWASSASRGLDKMDALSQRHIWNMQTDLVTEEPRETRASFVVLLTGATGSLGSHVLAQLSRNPLVTTVVCLYRQVSKTLQNSSTTQNAALDRLKASVSSAGIALSPENWAKVELMDNAEFVASCNDRRRKARLSNDAFESLARRTTHIVHLAWPMDFHRSLDSFTPHIDMVRDLVYFSRASHAIQSQGSLKPAPTRLLFASSIAVARHFTCGNGSKRNTPGTIPESSMDNPEVAAPMGYAQAKWVCEQMLLHVHKTLGFEVEPVVLRIGQLSGPEDTKGVWKMGEHIPTLMKASNIIGAVPSLHGAMSWLPADRAGSSIMDILLHSGRLDPVLHVENPVRQPADAVMTIMATELGLSQVNKIPYAEWLHRAVESGAIDSLTHFFKNDFQDLALGRVTLDTGKARVVSRTLRGSSGLTRDLLLEYMRRWREQGLFRAKLA